MIIKDINLRKIIDSRGNPTVEADIITNDGFGRAAAPAGVIPTLSSLGRCSERTQRCVISAPLK